MAVGHVLGQAASAKPGLASLGHFGKFDPRHAIGDIDTTSLATQRADVVANCRQAMSAPFRRTIEIASVRIRAPL